MLLSASVPSENYLASPRILVSVLNESIESEKLDRDEDHNLDELETSERFEGIK